MDAAIQSEKHQDQVMQIADELRFYSDIIRQQQSKIDRLQAAGDGLAMKLEQVIASKRSLLLTLPKTKDPQILAGRQSVMTDLEEALAVWNAAKEMR